LHADDILRGSPISLLFQSLSAESGWAKNWTRFTSTARDLAVYGTSSTFEHRTVSIPERSNRVCLHPSSPGRNIIRLARADNHSLAPIEAARQYLSLRHPSAIQGQRCTPRRLAHRNCPRGDQGVGWRVTRYGDPKGRDHSPARQPALYFYRSAPGLGYLRTMLSTLWFRLCRLRVCRGGDVVPMTPEMRPGLLTLR
jgi:hypothetical protein